MNSATRKLKLVLHCLHVKQKLSNCFKDSNHLRMNEPNSSHQKLTSDHIRNAAFLSFT